MRAFFVLASAMMGFPLLVAAQVIDAPLYDDYYAHEVSFPSREARDAGTVAVLEGPGSLVLGYSQSAENYPKIALQPGSQITTSTPWDGVFRGFLPAAKPKADALQLSTALEQTTGGFQYTEVLQSYSIGATAQNWEITPAPQVAFATTVADGQPLYIAVQHQGQWYLGEGMRCTVSEGLCTATLPSTFSAVALVKAYPNICSLPSRVANGMVDNVQCRVTCKYRYEYREDTQTCEKTSQTGVVYEALPLFQAKETAVPTGTTSVGRGAKDPTVSFAESFYKKKQALLTPSTAPSDGRFKLAQWLDRTHPDEITTVLGGSASTPTETPDDAETAELPPALPVAGSGGQWLIFFFFLALCGYMLTLQRRS
ncbi:hypothetical protein H6771_02270 [Candidatus Peribacteria bacterium]|nr:hypothetical protein [Candidatus Peribacteria bacterium]